MKKLLILAGLAALLNACDERNELINLTDNDKLTIDSTYASKKLPNPQPHAVYIEELTGVRCDNCPTAHAKIEKLKTNNPGRVVSLSIHTNDPILGKPYVDIEKRFNNQQGNQLISILGSYTGLPTGDVDRKVFSGESTLLTSYIKWESFVGQEIAIPSPVNISFIEKSVDQTKHTVDGYVKVIYTSAVPDPQYFTLILTESNITAPQLTVVDIDSSYTHNNVFRKAFSSYNGNLLASRADAGATYVLHFHGSVDPEWVPANLKLIGLIHHRTGNDNVVIQAAETTVQ